MTAAARSIRSFGWRGRLVALVGIVLVGLNLRIAVASVSPILTQIRADVAITDTEAGLLGMIPALVFAAAGPLAPLLADRIGLEVAIALAMAVSASGEFARSLVSTPMAFLALSVVALAGMGMGNILLPPLIKRYFPDRLGAVMSCYSVTLAIGAALPPLFAVRLTQSAGWRTAVGVWALAGIAAIVPWLTIVLAAIRAKLRLREIIAAGPPGEKAALREAGRSGPWRAPVAWAITACFAVNSTIGYSFFAWLPQLLQDSGLTAQAASNWLSMFSFMTIPASFLVPILVTRMRRPQLLAIVMAAGYFSGFAGLIVSPGDPTWLWITLTRFGDAFFPYALSMIAVRSRTAVGSTQLSGFVQGVGYSFAAFGPLLFGLLHQWTGGWQLPLIVLVALVPFQAVGAWIAGRSPTVEDQLAARAARP